MLKILTFIIVGYIVFRYFSSTKTIEEPIENIEDDETDFADYEEIE
jgi:hypothetical protein